MTLTLEAALLTSVAHAGYYVFNTPPDINRNTYGEVGILDMPTARMAPDGQLAFTFGALGDQTRYGLSFQALPWLETEFRFSHVVGMFPGYDRTHVYDRSFSVKARVIKETELFPDVSIGIRDIMGTGEYSAEYLVATKSAGSFDVTAGLGWGHLAQRAAFGNPIGYVFKSAKTRPEYSGTGQLDFGLFFRGPKTGAFGAVAWQSPIEGLQLLAEYSSDKYSEYQYAGGIKARSPVNLGLSYRPLDTFAVSAGWFYGSAYGITLSVSGDLTKTYPSAMRIGPAVPPPAIRTSTEQELAQHSMLKWNTALSSVRQGKPWSRVLTSDQYVRQNLLQIFLSETSGVRNVELEGTSLIVDATLSTEPSAQCVKYARLASASSTGFKTIALVDFQHPNGEVFVCPAATKSAPPIAIGGTMGPPALTKDVRDKIATHLSKQGLTFDGISVAFNEAWLYYENYQYNQVAEAAGRATRVLMADLPPEIETLHLETSYLGLDLNEITVNRSGFERKLSGQAGGELLLGNVVNISRPPLNDQGRDRLIDETLPTFSFAFDPKLTQHIFDPDHPIQFMAYGDATGLLRITRNLTLSVELTGQLWSNYTYERSADSDLQHVRSDVLQYLGRGKYGIAGLQLVYRSRLARDLYAEARGGYLEDMFMGFGGQLMWRPAESRFVLGADLYQVWQRSYNRLFGLQRYGNKHYDVLTGHVSAYYASPWYGLNMAVHVGRYLAGDRGVTFEVGRRFASGVEIGTWATFTNVPFSKFGEGSFDKGIMLHIPFEWGLPIWSQSSYDLHLNSLTRDGGQRLSGDDSLYSVTDAGSYNEIVDHLDELGEP